MSSCFPSSYEVEKEEVRPGAGLKEPSLITVVHEKIEAHVRLADLGLTYEIVRNAVLIGELARSSCTENDPPAAPGFFGWSRTTRGFREGTIPLGWKRSNGVGELATTVDPTGRIAIAVATGCKNTGNPYATPKTKYPKGPATVAAVERNRVQLNLFVPFNPVPSDPTEAVTWLLLLSHSGKEISVELSLPNAIGADDRVESWVERIIVDPISVEPTPNFGKLEEAVDFSDIDVTRRTS